MSIARVMKGEDYGGIKQKNRYVHCRHCGFPCDTMRDKLGDGSGATAILVSQPVDSADYNPSIYMEIVGGVATVPTDLSADGSIRAVKRETAVEMILGCPLCGSRNYL
jgi:hypothetical protein